MNPSPDPNRHIRPHPAENTASRPLCPSQTAEGQISTQVGDDWGIPGVVCNLLPESSIFLGDSGCLLSSFPVALEDKSLLTSNSLRFYYRHHQAVKREMKYPSLVSTDVQGPWWWNG